jgi:hypothetical protein
VQEYEKHPAVKLSGLGKSVRVLSIPVAGQPSATKMIPFVVETQALQTARAEQKAVILSEAAVVSTAEGGEVKETSDLKVESTGQQAILRQ